mmetsp:Transcript_134878/g.419090  ORF Transcript_134878/g.419090 Transcript_134878/m.419090 type:complete len:276 (-) Transcript_134878:607-1434(-)
MARWYTSVFFMISFALEAAVVPPLPLSIDMIAFLTTCNSSVRMRGTCLRAAYCGWPMSAITAATKPGGSCIRPKVIRTMLCTSSVPSSCIPNETNPSLLRQATSSSSMLPGLEDSSTKCPGSLERKAFTYSRTSPLCMDASSYPSSKSKRPILSSDPSWEDTRSPLAASPCAVHGSLSEILDTREDRLSSIETFALRTSKISLWGTESWPYFRWTHCVSRSPTGSASKDVSGSASNIRERSTIGTRNGTTLVFRSCFFGWWSKASELPYMVISCC